MRALTLALLLFTSTANAGAIGSGAIGSASGGGGGGGSFTGGTLTSQLLLDATNTLCSQTLSLAFAGDTDTGLQRAAANTLSICVGGALSLQLTTTTLTTVLPLVVDTAGGANATISETTLDRPSGSATTWSFTNSGAGVLDLSSDGDVTAGDDLIAGDDIVASGNNLTINGVAYTMPSSGGTAGEILTDVAGDQILSWEAPAAGSVAIGGAVTGGTAGSVLFVNPSATLAQDNATFFWDATNKRLNLGTATDSGHRLQIIQDNNQARVKSTLSTGAATIDYRNNADNDLQITQWGSAAAGTLGGLARTNLASIYSASSAPFLLESIDAQPLVIGTNDVERMRVLSTGEVGIGTSTPGDPLEVRKDQNTGTVTRSKNATVGTASQAAVVSQSDVVNLAVQAFSSAFTASGLNQPNATKIRAGTSGALHSLQLVTGAASPIIFGVNDTDVGRFEGAGTGFTVVGDVAVNGGDLTTSASTFNVAASATATTVNGGSGSSGCTFTGGDLVCSGTINGGGGSLSSVLASDTTNTTATPATIMTVALGVGTFQCKAHGIATSTVSTDGIEVRLNTSGLTATGNSSTTGVLSSDVTPVDIDHQVIQSGASLTVGDGDTFTSGFWEIDSLLVVTTGGNLVVDFALSTATASTGTAYAGSYLRCEAL